MFGMNSGTIIKPGPLTVSSVDSFAFGGTFKKGTSVFSSVFFEVQRCH